MKNIRQQRDDERDKAAQIFTWCMVVAMHQEEGIGATRLERAMEAVSAKMAAERGITRQPLAVLSQSEISRRMSAI